MAATICTLSSCNRGGDTTKGKETAALPDLTVVFDETTRQALLTFLLDERIAPIAADSYADAEVAWLRDQLAASVTPQDE